MDTLIVGAGGHGKVVLDILRAAGQYRPLGFVDADPARHGTTVGGLPVLGAMNLLPKLRQQHRHLRYAIVAIGDNRARPTIAAKLAEAGLALANAVHPSAVVSPSAVLGRNVVVAAQAVVCAEAQVGDSVIVNTAAVVEHECEVADAAHVAPTAALAGRVRVGRGAFVGLGAKVIPCLTIGEFAVVGAGAVCVADVPAYATVVGVPARVIKVAAPAAVALAPH